MAAKEARTRVESFCWQTLKGHTQIVCSVVFSPDSSLLASASNDNTVRLWNIPKSDLNAELKGHEYGVLSVAFSPDGKSIVTGSGDKTVRTWSIATKQQVKILTGHSWDVQSVAWSPNGDLIASGSHDTTVILWDAISGSVKNTLTGHTSYVMSVSFSPNGNKLASAGLADKTAIIWDVNSGAGLIKLAHSSDVLSVCFSHNDQFVTGCEDKIVRMFNANTGQKEKRFEGHTGRVRSVAWSFDGSMIASGLDDKSVRLWDVASAKQLQQLDGHTDTVNSVAFSRDGKYIASGSSDNSVRLWAAPSWFLPRQIPTKFVSPEILKTPQKRHPMPIIDASPDIPIIKTPQKPVAEWSVEDVCSYFKLAKIDNEVIALFRKHKIRGTLLASKANDEDLRSMGIEAIGDREDVIAAISMVFNSSSPARPTGGYDVFVSYRRNGGSSLAYIITQALRQKGFYVFFDIGSLSVGDYEQAIGSALKSARCVVLVMSPGALDRCLIKNDPEGKDWVRKEITMALKEGKNLLPVLDPYFTFPDPQELPEDMRRVTSYNGIKWYAEYPEAALEKLQKFIKDSTLKH